MAVREILQLGHPRLWEVSPAVADVTGNETGDIITDLRDTLIDFRKVNGFGRGIAAPQIGVLKRIIYIIMPSGESEGAMINPEIIRADEHSSEIWDACFSLPNLMVRVSRSVRITVAFTDESGARRKLTAEGDLSELLQHEIDHLDGILAVERAVTPRSFATYDQWKKYHREE